MKYFSFLVLIIFTSFNAFSQRKPEPKPALPAAAPKPKGPSPYVMKKDYDSSITKLSNQMKGIQQSINSVKGGINSKDAELKYMNEKMKQVEEVLNSTNFKIALTSDSLNKTQLSLEEIHKNNELRFSAQEAKIIKAESYIFLLWAFVLIAIISAGLIWFLLNKKIKQLENKINKSFEENRSLIHENQEGLNKQVKQLESQLNTETRNNKHFAERLNNAVKEDINIIQNESKNMASTIAVISAEINDLHDRIKPNNA